MQHQYSPSGCGSATHILLLSSFCNILQFRDLISPGNLLLKKHWNSTFHMHLDKSALHCSIANKVISEWERAYFPFGKYVHRGVAFAFWEGEFWLVVVLIWAKQHLVHTQWIKWNESETPIPSTSHSCSAVSGPDKWPGASLQATSCVRSQSMPVIWCNGLTSCTGSSDGVTPCASFTTYQCSSNVLSHFIWPTELPKALESWQQGSGN